MKSKINFLSFIAALMWSVTGCSYSIPVVYFTDRDELVPLVNYATALIEKRIGCRAFISGHLSDYQPGRSVNITIGIPRDIRSAESSEQPWGYYNELDEVLYLKEEYLSESAQLITLLHEMAHSVGIGHDESPNKLMSKRFAYNLLLLSDEEIIDEFAKIVFANIENVCEK